MSLFSDFALVLVIGVGGYVLWRNRSKFSFKGVSLPAIFPAGSNSGGSIGSGSSGNIFSRIGSGIYSGLSWAGTKVSNMVGWSIGKVKKVITSPFKWIGNKIKSVFTRKPAEKKRGLFFNQRGIRVVI